MDRIVVKEEKGHRTVHIERESGATLPLVFDVNALCVLETLTGRAISDVAREAATGTIAAHVLRATLVAGSQAHAKRKGRGMGIGIDAAAEVLDEVGLRGGLDVLQAALDVAFPPADSVPKLADEPAPGAEVSA